MAYEVQLVVAIVYGMLNIAYLQVGWKEEERKKVEIELNYVWVMINLQSNLQSEQTCIKANEWKTI